jgi:hypothetical protein
VTSLRRIRLGSARLLYLERPDISSISTIEIADPWEVDQARIASLISWLAG